MSTASSSAPSDGALGREVGDSGEKLVSKVDRGQMICGLIEFIKVGDFILRCKGKVAGNHYQSILKELGFPLWQLVTLLFYFF